MKTHLFASASSLAIAALLPPLKVFFINQIPAHADWVQYSKWPDYVTTWFD